MHARRPRLAVTRPLTPPHGTSRLRRTRGERRPGRPAPRPNGQKRARSTCLRPLERGDRATTATRPTPSRPVGALWMAMPMQVLSGHPLARVRVLPKLSRTHSSKLNRHVLVYQKLRTNSATTTTRPTIGPAVSCLASFDVIWDPVVFTCCAPNVSHCLPTYNLELCIICSLLIVLDWLSRFQLGNQMGQRKGRVRENTS